VIDSLVYFLVNRGGVTHVERWNPSIGQYSLAEGAPFGTLLDSRMTEEEVNLQYIGGLTTLTLPYPIDAGVRGVICTRGADAGIELASFTGNGSAIYMLSGDVTARDLWIGLSYTASVRLSRPTVTQPSGSGGRIAITGGNFQVLYGRVSINDSFPFSVLVEHTDREPYTYKMTEADLGSLKTNPPTPNDGEYRFATYGRANALTVTLINDTPYPSSWLSLAWEGRFTKIKRTL
jgi:hypothetical protein